MSTPALGPGATDAGAPTIQADYETRHDWTDHPGIAGQREAGRQLAHEKIMADLAAFENGNGLRHLGEPVASDCQEPIV